MRRQPRDSRRSPRRIATPSPRRDKYRLKVASPELAFASGLDPEQPSEQNEGPRGTSALGRSRTTPKERVQCPRSPARQKPFSPPERHARWRLRCPHSGGRRAGCPNGVCQSLCTSHRDSPPDTQIGGFAPHRYNWERVTLRLNGCPDGQAYDGVGERGLEPPTSTSQTWRSTGLSYSPSP